ncbi:hypothetical protein ACFV3E_40885 [Streptomyces sp. NPDC059718]
MGRLIQQRLPAAATLTADVASGDLRAVRSADGGTLWFAPTDTTGLPVQVVEEVEGAVRELLQLGKDAWSLDDAGWTDPGPGGDTYDLALPEA